MSFLCLNPPTLLITVCLLSMTRTKADWKWKKDDNAIYSKPSVPDLPIKYRTQKGKQEGDKTQNSEAMKQREHL